MHTKLTLRLEAELIAQIKTYAQQQGKSLSQLVADYFAQLVRPQPSATIAPLTRSLVGILQPAQLDEADYKRHLEEKYL